MIKKENRLKSKKIRESARGEDCAINIVGVCNYNPETVVLCHLQGGGVKSADTMAAYGCSDCHDAIDGRRYKDNEGNNLIISKLKLEHLRGCLKTNKKLLEKGLISKTLYDETIEELKRRMNE